MSTNHISNHNSKRGYGDMDNRRIGCGQGSWDQQDDGDTTKMMEDQREQFQQPDDAEGDGNGPTGYNTPPRYFEGDIEHDDDGGGGGDDEDYLDGESGHMYHDDSYQFQRADSGEFYPDGQYVTGDHRQPFDENMDRSYVDDDDQPPGNDPDDTPLRSNTRPARIATGNDYRGEGHYGADEYVADPNLGDMQDQGGMKSRADQDEVQEGIPTMPVIQKDSIVQEVRVMVDERLQNMRFHTNRLLKELEFYVETLGNTERTYLQVQQDVHAEADHLDRCEENVERAINGLGLSIQGQHMLVEGNEGGNSEGGQPRLSQQAGMAGTMNLSALGRRNSHDSQGSGGNTGRISRQGSFEDHH